MALVKIGFISDSHYAKAADDSGDLFRSHAIGKITQALNHFIAEGVDVICAMGDMVENPEECYDSPFRLHELAQLINGQGPVSHNIPVLWCVGNHDVDDTTGPDKFKADWCAETGATCIDNGINHEGDIVRDHLDLGTKLRIVSLDNQFNSSFISLPVTQTYGYVHPDELTWLETVLSEADAAGRFSVVLTHMPLVFTTQIGNAASVLNIVKSHNVIGCFAGHSHQEHLANGDQNPLGEIIRHFIIPDIRRGDFNTNKSSIRRRKKSAPPGSPPSSHTGLLRRFIFFGYDPAKRSVVIGPVALNAKNTDAPKTLEHGGATTLDVGKRKKRITIKARPFMGPAYKKEEPKLPQMWQDSVIQPGPKLTSIAASGPPTGAPGISSAGSPLMFRWQICSGCSN